MKFKKIEMNFKKIKPNIDKREYGNLCKVNNFWFGWY